MLTAIRMCHFAFHMRIQFVHLLLSTLQGHESSAGRL